MGTRALKRTSQVSPRTVWVVGLNVLLLVGALIVIREAWTVISWILIAAFIALALDPLVRWLHHKLHLRRGLAILAVFLLAFGTVTLLVVKFAPMLAAQGKRLVTSGPELMGKLKENRAFAWADERFNVIEFAKEIPDKAGGIAMGIAGKVAEGVAASITIISLTIFMLLFGGDLFRAFLGWFEPNQRQRFKMLAKRMHNRVGGYVSGTLLIAAIGGGVIGTTLAILGNPYFLPLGLVMIFLGVIPWAGSALGAVLVVMTTFAAQGPKQALIVLGIYLVYQQVEGHVLQPVIQRRTIKMNPLLIAIVMLIGTSITGLLGTLLALPVAGATQVVLQDVRARRKAKWERRLNKKRREDHAQLPLFGRRPGQEPPSLPH